MSREHKLALVVSFTLILVLGVLISDHFSKASRNAPLAVELREPPDGPFGASGASTAAAPAVTLPATHPTENPLPPAADRPGSPGSPAPGVRLADNRGTADVPVPGVPLSKTAEGAIAAEQPPPTTGLPLSGGVVKRHDVKEGDSIYDISRRYYGDGNLWTKLRDCNKGKVTESGGMRGGITLDIPPKDVLLGKARLGDTRSAAASSVSVVVDDPVAARPDPKVEPKAAGTAYVVQEGDTLHSIARKKLGSAKRVSELIDANKGALDDPDDLKVGMSIRIPAR